MGSRALHIFNPEHDLSLAVGNMTYTAPREIRNLKKLLSLLPASYAGNGDFILIPDELTPQEIPSLKFYKTAIEKNITLVSKEDIVKISPLLDKVTPWGWDYALKIQLKNYGIQEDLLLSDSRLEDIRRLSHRRLTISFRQKIAQSLRNLNNPAEISNKVCSNNSYLKNIPCELFSNKEVTEFLEIHSPAYFKAPWSSSGYGLIVSDHISPKGLAEWTHGVIKRQGSVMAEPVWDRTLDFATEWSIDNGNITFVGYSVFNASNRGKYHGNLVAPQYELLDIILRKAPAFSSAYIEAQRKALEELVAPYYDGPLGIDMLADQKGDINPCVEINLRLTMGHISVKKSTN